MIVRDEEAVIERCLDSVLPVVDHVVIVDTGSVDKTADAIERAWRRRRGGGRMVVVNRPWMNYSHNRNEALQYARDLLQATGDTWQDDYIMVMDADDVLRPCTRPTLSDGAPGYGALYYMEDLGWGRVILAKAGLPWSYYFPVHEMLMRCENDHTSDIKDSGFRVDCNVGMPYQGPEHFLKDVVLLEEYLKTHPDCARSQFYLAQSYQCAGDSKKALQHYAKRTQMEGYSEETLVSWLRLGEIADDPGAFLEAAAMNATRAEGLYLTALWCEKKGMRTLATVLAIEAYNRKSPAGMFVNKSVYQWRAAALVASLTGNKELAKQVVDTPGAEYGTGLLELAK